MNVMDTATFVCTSNKPVFWHFDQRELPPNAVTFSKKGSLRNTLTITDTLLDNAGSYQCSGSNKDTMVFEDEGYLTVLGMDKFLFCLTQTHIQKFVYK